jgi:hypothetical protein
MQRFEWEKMQAEAAATPAQTSHERQTLTTIVLLAEICSKLDDLAAQLRARK